MATVAPERLRRCDGFRVETPERLVGWVEETWLDPADEPAALAVRAPDGRRGFLRVEDVDAVLEDGETVVVRGEPSLLELEAPLRRPWVERPLWQVIGLLYAGIITLAALVITLAFLVGRALA